MEQDKKPDGAGADQGSAEQSTPKDALEKTNEELGLKGGNDDLNPDGTKVEAGEKPAKQLSGFKKLWKKINIYLLLFCLVLVIGIAVAVVSYLNSKKTPKAPDTASQSLTADTLKKLANSDATVGDTGQTLTIQGNAIVTGQMLVRNNLSVAGTISVSSPVTFTEMTVSNTANLNTTQTNTLQVAQGSTFQGVATFQGGINVAGAAAFTGTVTIGNLNVTHLTLSGNAVLEVPNHLAFTGASPGRSSINQTVLGPGGTASLNGSDTTGTVNIHTGANTAAGCFLVITFNRPFTNTPHVLVSPVENGAGQTQYYVGNRTTTGFSLCTANAPPINSVFAYDYFITD
ncbi:MAG TPA: hypothetical protein VLF59_03880 [Candidatus Saccharimonadales bacterium]|nr:hypothetical protein [Candidatus Saccharimonadales bacterium]